MINTSAKLLFVVFILNAFYFMLVKKQIKGYKKMYMTQGQKLTFIGSSHLGP
jgi:preprotein translocase subunit YajC